MSQHAHKVTREQVPPSLPPREIHQFSAPPPILGCIRNPNDIPCLEIEFIVNRGSIVIQRHNCRTEISD